VFKDPAQVQLQKVKDGRVVDTAEMVPRPFAVKVFKIGAFFICFFVCLFIKPEKPYSASCWEGSKPPGSDHTQAEAQTTCIPKAAIQTTYIFRIPSHQTASPHALYDVLVLDGGRGETVNDLVDRDRELPANEFLTAS